MQSTIAASPPLPCPRCFKRSELCICEGLPTLSPRTSILIIQHPQEPDKDLGTARIANLILSNSTLKIGLSWPNLKKALGREATSARWGVLYLGSGLKESRSPGLHWVRKNGTPLPTADSKTIQTELEGLVVLDGTWSQAKALWWRNAWLLKLKRAILVPSHPSLYKELRREPKRECLSTIESIADSLDALGEPATTSESLRSAFVRLLDRKRKLK